MTLPELSIKRSVMTVMFCAVFVIFGVIGYFRIGVQKNPNITYPQISIVTSLPGSDPGLITQTITKPIEEAVNAISGVHQINSTSLQGKSTVNLQFNVGVDMDAAFNQVQSKINQIRNQFPYDTQPPLINKANVNAQPIMLIAVYGNRTVSQLRRFAEKVIKPKLANIPGVGDIKIEGASKEVVKVELNINQLAALKISPQQVQSAFAAEHVQKPGGYVKQNKRQYSLNLDLEYHNIKELGNLIVTYRKGTPVYLKEVATITMGQQQSDQFARFNGQQTVGLSIVKKANANTVEIARMVNERMKNKVAPLLPKSIGTSVVFSQANYVQAIIHSLETDAWLSILTAAIVIFLFLKNFRSTAVILASIPVSLLGAVMAIYFFHYTFNVVTLLGIILLVGVVVDDSIVVLENIDRYGSKLGKNSVDAAVQGSNQVVFAVLASSLSLVSIFIPVIFMGGIVGLMFQSFAVVVTVGVLVSLFVSMSLTPMLCSKILKSGAGEQKKHGFIYNFLESIFVAIEKMYTIIIRFCLKVNWLVIIAAVIIVALAVPIFSHVGKAFMPADNDNGYFFVQIQTPQGSSALYTKNRLEAVEQVLNKYPDVRNYFASVGPATKGSLTVNLVPRDELSMTQPEFMSFIQKELKKVPGIMAFVNTAGKGGQIEFSLLGPTADGVLQQGYRFYYALAKHPEFGSLYIHVANDQPEYLTILDRELANSVGVSSSEIANTLMILGPGVRIGKFKLSDRNERNNIILKSQKGQFTGPSDLANVYLHSKKIQDLVRLDSLVALEASVAPVEITRLNLEYSVGFSTKPKMSMGKAVALVKDIAAKIMPPGYALQVTGNAASMAKTTHRITFALIMIIVLMYMVLASQFNSYIQPFYVLIALPLALTGGLLTLYVTSQTLNVYSMIGMLLLMGLVAKNSILLIDLTNQTRAADKSLTISEALLIACPTRMRPVLMTSLAIIFAMIPSAFSTGPGAAEHKPLSLVIIGGMVSSTILTLIVVPSMYKVVETLLSGNRGKKQKKIAVSAEDAG